MQRTNSHKISWTSTSITLLKYGLPNKYAKFSFTESWDRQDIYIWYVGSNIVLLQHNVTL